MEGLLGGLELDDLSSLPTQTLYKEKVTAYCNLFRDQDQYKQVLHITELFAACPPPSIFCQTESCHLKKKKSQLVLEGWMKWSTRLLRFCSIPLFWMLPKSLWGKAEAGMGWTF